MSDPRDPSQRGAKRPAASPRVRRTTASSTPRAPKARAPRTPRRRRRLRLATGPFRLWSAFGVVAFVLSLFAGRLIQLQGVDAEDYAAMAVKLGSQTITLEAPRAPIYDRTGVELAETVDADKLVADPTYTSKHAVQIATLLHDRIGVNYIQTVAELRTPNTRYVELVRHLAPQKATAIVDELNARNLPGVYTEHDTMRVYPDDDVAANLIGFVGNEGQGLAGFEEAYDKTLRGHNGKATYQVEDGQILPLANKSVVEPRDGTGVRLTIDADLQYLAQQRLTAAVKAADGDSGVAIVMDARTSQVLALADYPTYNPNHFARADKHYYISRALYDAYEPGSVEKVLTSSALIDAGYATPETKVVVPPDVYADGNYIHDDFGHGILHLTLAGIIAESSNVGMITAAAKMPNAQLYGYLKKFGIGQPLDVGLPNTSGGYLAPPSTWIPLHRDDIDFGQGVSVNALQMAAAIAAVAHGGVYTKPSLVAGTVSSQGTFTPAKAPEHHRVISASAASQVRSMMEAVVYAEGGTGPVAQIDGYQVAGKTGTAQRADSSCSCYKGYTVSFAGFAPADNPRFVVYVVVQNPRIADAFGSTVAGPVFHDLMVDALKKYGVPPSGRKPTVPKTTW